MPQGRTYTGKEAAQKVLDMSTDSNMDSSVDSEPEDYMDTVLRRDAVKHVYGRKHGHTDSSVADKDKLSDDSFEFQEDELQMSPQCTLQNLCSLRKRVHSRSPIPSMSGAKPPMRCTSTPTGSGGDMVSLPLDPIAGTSSMPTHSRRTSNPGNASGCGTPPSAVLKCPQRTSTPVASTPVKSTLTSAMRRHSHRSSMPIWASPSLPKCPPRASMPGDSGSDMDSSWDSDRLNMGNMDISTDSKVQLRLCFTEDHDEPSGDEDDTLTHGIAGSDADDKDSCSSHACFSEDYVEAESDVDDEPPLMNSPPPHPQSWMAKMTTLVSPQRRRVQGFATEGHGGKRNKGLGIKNTL